MAIVMLAFWGTAIVMTCPRRDENWNVDLQIRLQSADEYILVYIVTILMQYLRELAIFIKIKSNIQILWFKLILNCYDAPT